MLLTLFTMGSMRTYLPWGGAIWPPGHKVPETWSLLMKLGMIHKGGLNFRMNPNMTHPGSC